jgi:hypothetical protein
VANGRVYPIGPVIEGYSVDEAASVLGVPKGRVWELLARGVLAGTPEDGGGMRVYLQGRPMEPIVGRPPEGRPGETASHSGGGNGNGGEHGQPGFEASPFRELLTEFRNLTERYGQALLALGEARGEVASLRTRVELLEARIDLRLPSAPPLVQWSPPQQPIPQEPEAPRDRMEPMPEPIAEAAGDLARAQDEPEAASGGFESSILAPTLEDEPISRVDETRAPAMEAGQARADAPVGKSSRRRRRRQSARSATKEFPAALARAQDPTVSQLPGGDETQAAFDELRERFRRESLTDEASEPMEAFAEDAEDAMGLAEIAAPAEEVELDSLLADDELGGSMHEATVMDAVTLEPAEPVLETEPPLEAEPAPAPLDQGPQAAAQPVGAEEIAPIQEAELEIPEASAITVEPVQVAAGAEPDQAPEDLQALEPESIGQEQEAAAAEPNEQTVAAAPAYSHEWDEPDWIAEEDVDWGAGEAAAPGEPVAMGESPEIGWEELPAATVQAPVEHAAEGVAAEDPSVTDLSELSESSESTALAVDLEPAPSLSPEASEPRAIEVEAVGPPAYPAAPLEEPTGGREDQPPDAGSMTAQSSEEELMWLGDEFRAGPTAWSAPGRATTIPKPMAPPAEGTVSPAEDEALARLAVERGWDDEELHAIRSLLAQPVRTSVDDTQRDETDWEAMAPALPQVLPRVPVAPPQTEDAHSSETADVAPQSAEAEDAEAREEEAFDWEQGPSAWSPPPTARASLELPGAVELDQAMAAFEVGAWSKESAVHDDPRPRDEPAASDSARGEELRPQNMLQPPAATQRESESNAIRSDGPDTAPQSDATPPAPPAARRASPSVNPAEPSGGEDAAWLRGRRGPAATAYRRLRRLFP